MTTPVEKAALSVDESVERILGNARPRPVPSREETEEVRQRIHAEWQEVTGRRQRKQRFTKFAIAASVLLAVFVSFNSLRQFGVAEPQVASIQKSFGSIYVLGDNAEMLAGNELRTVVAGQTLITDEASGVGLQWENGGSLRIGADTRVEFISDDSLFLQSGRIYFDSKPKLLAGAASNSPTAKLTIRTDFGTVSHVGTQYMTVAERNSLIVSVREGEVVLDAGSQQQSASGGQRLAVKGNGRATVTNIKTYGDRWTWAEQLSPDADIDGRPIHEFLDWVSHETGLDVQYSAIELETYSKQKSLAGIVKMDPINALAFYMRGVDLDYEIQDGVINIVDVDQL